MKATVVRSSRADSPSNVASFIPHITHLTVGREYSVECVTTYAGIALFQIVNDTGSASWLPAWLFQVTSPDIPSDWICNIFGHGQVVIGPEFIAANEASYADMIELKPDKVSQFWDRIDRNNESAR